MSLFFQQFVAFFLTLSMTLAPYAGVVFHGGKRAFFENWSKDQAFTDDYAVTLEKDPDKDFVILNLADIQMRDKETFGEAGRLAKATIDRLVEETRPDLITFSGDNAWQMLSYNETIKMIDAYGIPWAPVMGNHDGEGCPSEFWCAYNYTQAKNCLFRFGPADMGYGNYIINIKENGRIIHTLFMMDTHDKIESDNINGAKGSGYDHLWENQIEWYRWAVNGVTSLEGRAVESTVILHIPLYEYKTAWEEATDGNGQFVGEYAGVSFGVNHEGSWGAAENNGFFTELQQLGSTKNVLCGHDHINNYSILYKGIRLTYALKTGSGCYWEPELSGGTVITVNADGNAEVTHRFVAPDTLSY